MADPRPFMEIAAGFDPNMPEEQYEAVRQKYFNDVIMPRLSRGSSAIAAWNQFKTKTERPGKLTGMARAIVPVAQAATGFTAAFTRPLPTLAPHNEGLQKLAVGAQQAEDYVSKVAAREGIGQHIPLVGSITGAGELAGMAPYFALAEETGGETLGAVLPELGKTVLGRVATRGLLGGAAVGTYESIAAKDGNRFTAGAKGFASGALIGAGVGLLGAGVKGGVGSLATKLTSRGLATPEAVDEIRRNHLSGEGPVNPEVDQILDQELKESQQASNLEGRPKDIRSNPNVKGVVVSGRTAAEGEAQPWVVRVTSGAEKDAAKRVLDYTRKGGVVEDIIHNPDALETLNRYQQAMAEEHAERYKNARIEHAPGDAEGVAQEMRIDGKAAVAVSPDHVLVQDPVRATPTDSEIDDAVRQLKKPDPENPGQELDLTKADRLLMRKSIKALWDTDIPDEAKEPHAQLLSHWDLKDMIPSKWRWTVPNPFIEDIERGRAQEAEEAEDVKSRAAAAERMYGEAPDPEEARMVAEMKAAEEEYREGVKKRGVMTEPDLYAPTKSRQNLWTEGAALRKLNEPLQMAESLPPEMELALRSDVRTGAEPWGGLHIPESEQYALERNPYGGIRRVTYPTGQTLERGELYSTMRIRAEEMQKLFGGEIGEIKGTVVGPEELTKAAKALGLSIPSEFGEPNVPAMLLAPHASEMTETHEAMHIHKHTVPALASIMEKGGQVQSEIGKALRGRSPVYSVMPLSLLNEEAFVHAATSILHGDARGLAELVRMDGSLDDVMGMVRERAADIHNALRWDAVDGAPERLIQNQMEDLLRRTTSREAGDFAWELMNSAGDELKDYRYDPAARKWIETSGGRERVFSAKKEMLDDIAKRARAKDWAPSETLFAEMQGARGEIAPRNGGPVKDPLDMEEPPAAKWGWWQAFDQWIRPMGPWVADLHKRVNAVLEPYGKKLDIYNPFKDVDDAARAKAKWMEPVYDELDGALKGAGKKQLAYLDTLAEDPKYREGMLDQYGLSPEDLPKIRQLGELVDKLDAQDPQMKIRDFLTRDWKNFRSSGRDVGQFFDFANRPDSSLSPIERMIKNNRLDPRLGHAGAFMDRMIREIGNRKFTEEPLKKFEDLINRKANNGKYLLGDSRDTLQRYINYMRNIPDSSAQRINQTVKSFLESVSRQIERINKYLPATAQIPTDLGTSDVWINRLIAWSYAAGIGLRAMVPVRDALQTFITVLPVLGPGRFARGMARGLTREGWNFADENGALLGHRTIGETYGDIIDEIPRGSRLDKITELTNKLMAPSRWGHNPGRSIAFNGEYGDAIDAVGRYRRGEISFDELKHRDNTSLWWTDTPFQDRIKAQLEDRTGFSDHDVARNMANEILDLTLWPYRRGMQPSMLQTGAGRLFGQYGLWPTNYVDFARRGLSKLREPGSKASALQTIGMWTAVNYAGSNAMNAVGVDGSKMFWSGGPIELGPTGQLVLNIGKSFGNTPESRDARRQVWEYPLQFFPTHVEAASIWDAIESGAPLFDGEGHPTAEAIKLLGFTPLKNEQQRDLEDQLLYQMGETRTKSGAIRPTLVERERPPVQ